MRFTIYSCIEMQRCNKQTLPNWVLRQIGRATAEKVKIDNGLSFCIQCCVDTKKRAHRCDYFLNAFSKSQVLFAMIVKQLTNSPNSLSFLYKHNWEKAILQTDLWCFRFLTIQSIEEVRETYICHHESTNLFLAINLMRINGEI